MTFMKQGSSRVLVFTNLFDVPNDRNPQGAMHTSHKIVSFPVVNNK